MFIVPKKGGNYQSKIPQSVCGKTSLQDGRHQKSEGYTSRRRPDGQIGLEGRVLLHINYRKSSKIPTVLLEKSTVPIHLPTLQTEQCTPKLLHPILIFLRDKGVHCLMYLDDMLIPGRTDEELNHNFTLMKSLLTLWDFLSTRTNQFRVQHRS